MVSTAGCVIPKVGYAIGANMRFGGLLNRRWVVSVACVALFCLTVRYTSGKVKMESPDLENLGEKLNIDMKGGFPDGMGDMDESGMGDMDGSGMDIGDVDDEEDDVISAKKPKDDDPLKENRIRDVFTDDQKEKMDFEQHEYQVEVVRLMDVIINSLYQNKEVFIRELISNAADALEKIRFLSLENPEELDTGRDLAIFVDYSKEDKTVTIADTGVGMTKQDLINNLGTVAKSGTSNFLEALAQGSGVDLIGQFGVGFYSAYLVADKVVVTTKNNHDDQYIWESSATGHFGVTKDPRGTTIGRGTRITLHLKEDSLKMLSESLLKELCVKFSQFVSFPIKMLTQKSVTEDVPIPDGEWEKMKQEKEEERAKAIEAKKKATEEKGEEYEEEDKDTEEIEVPKTKKESKKVIDWVQLNQEKAIWLRNPKEAKLEEYHQFFKTIWKDYSPPLTYIHFTAEGEIEFKSILFIPNRAPHDLFANYKGDERTIKLYARRVFVGDKFQEDLLPQYLNFVKGVVDSDDLPLNVSRESLQQTKILNVIQKKLSRKILDMIKKIAKDSETAVRETQKEIEEATEEDKRAQLRKSLDEVDVYSKFLKEFGRNLKLGCYDDDSNRSKIAKLLRVHTSRSSDAKVSFDEYISRMSSSQKVIYYAFGESIQQLEKLPQMQIMKKKDIEVVYLIETMDEPCIQKLNDFEGKKFESIQKGDLTLEQTDDEKVREKKLLKMYDPLIRFMQEVLSGKVMKVAISRRLVDAPVAISSSGYGYSAYMEKIMKSQTFADTAQIGMMSGHKNMEINPDHPLVYELLQRYNRNNDDEMVKKTTLVLFDSAMLSSGFDVNNPAALAAVLYQSMNQQMGLDPEAAVTPIDVSYVDDDETKDDDIALDDDDDDLDMDVPDEKETVSSSKDDEKPTTPVNDEL